MKTYKVKSTMSVDVEVEVYANSEDEAYSKFYAMDLKDICDDGVVMRADSEETTAELYEAKFKVKATNIKYDINDWNIGDAAFLNDAQIEAEIERIRKSLPTEMVVEVDCRKEDVEHYVKEKITDETGIEVDYIDFEILEVK